MKKFEHSTHTAYEFKAKSGGIIIIKNTGNKLNLKSLLHYWKFYIKIPNGSRWFAIIRTPFFKFEKNNCGFEIGFPNFYLWIIH